MWKLSMSMWIKLAMELSIFEIERRIKWKHDNWTHVYMWTKTEHFVFFFFLSRAMRTSDNREGNQYADDWLLIKHFSVSHASFKRQQQEKRVN